MFAKLPSNGISTAKTGIVIKPFSITSPSSIAPIPVIPAITILPTSIKSLPIGLPLFAGSLIYAIAFLRELHPCFSIIQTFLIVPTIGPIIAVATVVNNVFPALMRCCFIFPIKEWIASFKLSNRVSRAFLDDLNHLTSFAIISLTSSANNCIRTARSAFPTIRKASSFCDFFRLR